MSDAPSKELITAPENPTLDDLIAFYGEDNFRSGVTVRVPYRATREALTSLQQKLAQAENRESAFRRANELLKMQVDAMEDCIGPRDGQTFEERAEELIVTEVNHENLRRASNELETAPCPTCAEACEMLGRAGIADGNLIDKVSDAIEAMERASPEPEPVPPKEPTPEWMLKARAEGRAEFLAILLGESAEDFAHDYTGDHPIGCTGDYGCHWKVEKLRATFAVDDATYSYIDTINGNWWSQQHQIETLQEELQRTSQPPSPEPLATVVCEWIERRRKELSKQGITGGHYIADLCLLEEAINECLSGVTSTKGA